ncbi:unnamed protein product [Linum trigynum]|uniref:Uncharacterized protein n=1 Tax=Linum trigynum TaxID=586398 RepID=A0AAV2DA92_9ROSI
MAMDSSSIGQDRSDIFLPATSIAALDHDGDKRGRAFRHAFIVGPLSPTLIDFRRTPLFLSETWRRIGDHGGEMESF